VFVVDGRTVTFTRTNAAAQPFVWDGIQAQEARMTARVGSSDVTLSGYGTWAVFRLFQAAQNWQVQGITQRASWITRQEGQAVPIPFELNLGGAPPIFSRTYFASATCSGQIAR
jgi:type VI protein secretion system component VasK